MFVCIRWISGATRVGITGVDNHLKLVVDGSGTVLESKHARRGVELVARTHKSLSIGHSHGTAILATGLLGILIHVRVDQCLGLVGGTWRRDDVGKVGLSGPIRSNGTIILIPTDCHAAQVIHLGVSLGSSLDDVGIAVLHGQQILVQTD